MSAVPTLVELEDYAESSHPSLKSSALQLDAARKGVTLAKKAYLPDFQVIGSSYTLRGPFASNFRRCLIALRLLYSILFLGKTTEQ
ncbi:TolC family protein [Polynucleobacter necessarius]|uniref:TolC family protein n=1 Tax=Polynucleobacter necessarius TaxID=576610 RepID=UPI0018D58F50|nr:TolC family protein [Polynucleobacter necessarius]